MPSIIEVTVAMWDANRERTLATLTAIEALPHPQEALGWRPGPGRAHIAWQLMHVGITEELFATERLIEGSKAAYPDLVPRFKGGSTPDDEIPPAALIRRVLTESRVHMRNALGTFKDSDLQVIPDWFKERGWTLERILQVLAWHESHHQGQAHITHNLWKASQV